MASLNHCIKAGSEPLLAKRAGSRDEPLPKQPSKGGEGLVPGETAIDC